MEEKNIHNKDELKTKNHNLNSERNDMNIENVLADSISNINPNTPVLCKEPITILPEFEEFITPENLDRNADGPMGDLKIDPIKAKNRRTLRFEMLKNEIELTQTVGPFLVWRQGQNIIQIDGRHDEYRAALQLGLPISIIDFEFNSINEARIFVACHCLNKSHLNASQRMLLVRRLEEDIRKIAKKYQGKRNDLVPKGKIQKFHTTKIMAALANVGEQTLRKFFAVIDDGPKYLQKGKTQEFIERIKANTLSVHNAHTRLIDAKKKVNDKKKFSDNNPELFPDSNEIDFNLNEDEEQNEDEIVYENPSLKNGPHNKILCGDRVDIMKQLPDAFCNLTCLSPEYNVERIHYDIPVPVLPYHSYLQKLNDLWVECARVLRDGGRLAINLPALVSVFEQNDHRSFNTPLFIDVIQEIKKLDVGLNLREALIWHKRSPIRKHHYSFPSPKNPCYRAEHEYILIFSKKSWEMTPENEGAPHDLTTDIYRDDCSSVLSIAPQSKGVGGHPAVYPETLVKKIVRMHSFVGDTICDFSNGSGTTTAISAFLGRRWFGCDISPLYCQVAENRTKKAYKQFLKGVNNVDKAQRDGKNAA